MRPNNTQRKNVQYGASLFGIVIGSLHVDSLLYMYSRHQQFNIVSKSAVPAYILFSFLPATVCNRFIPVVENIQLSFILWICFALWFKVSHTVFSEYRK